ncbi:kinesin-like protein KIF11-A [Thrips palmi]|uniref:Kinesin-like protein KIF11-A n=1 Tax=Thrips palmi TaxID=161013 RepID=A0A6P8XX11_THRPL|nr:kinesin-like protein KIF11-A [Thrips palmi]
MSAKKPKGPAKVQKNQYMQVFVRCRPPNDNEVNQRYNSSVDIQGQKDISVQDRCNSKITKTFSFDKVFEPSATQTDVYQAVVDPLIKDVLNGFNCTVFAYGQTGSGKTFTMEGDIGSDKMFAADSRAGLIPRAVCALFDELRVLQVEYTVRISLLELYNEELYDLLSPDEVPPKLRLFDDVAKKGSVIIQGLQEVMVHNQSQVLDELRKGSAKRQVAATLMNAQSSRSHTIFCVTVHSKENPVDGEELLKTGKLNLVDLAGSENIGRSGSLDKRAREAASINQSLLTLSRVTACLVEHQPHVPYRESKLTRLLQDSLGGRTKASLIATISPASSNAEETLSTLDYAHRAKSVANRPEVNQKISQTVVMKEYMDVIQDLKKKLELTRNGSGVYVNDENYKQIVAQTQEKNKEITDLISKIRSVGLLKKTTEETYLAFTKMHENELKNLEHVDNAIAQNTEEIGFASQTLTKVKCEKDEAENLLGNLVDKENELLRQAEQLTNVVDVTQSDSCKIHDKLEFSRVVLVENEAVLKKIRERGNFHRMATLRLWSSIVANSSKLEELENAIDSLPVTYRSQLAVVRDSIQKYKDKTRETTKELNHHLDKAKEIQNRSNQKSNEDLVRLYLNLVKTVESTEKILRAVCDDFKNLISNLPSQTSSCVDFLNESVLKLKEVSKSQVTEMAEHFDKICLETDSNIETVCKLMNNLLASQKKPISKITNRVESMIERVNRIRSICLEEHEETTAHKVDLLKCKEEIARKTSLVLEHSSAAVEFLQQQQNDVATNCKNMDAVFRDSNKPLLQGYQDFATSMNNTVSKSVETVEKAEEEITKLLSCDHLTPWKEAVSEIMDSRSECLQYINKPLVGWKDVAQETEQLDHNLSLEFKGLENINHDYVVKGNEVLGMFLKGAQSASSEILEQLENGKSVVNQLLSEEIKHDVPTGRTPIRKSYGPIPEPTGLPSPITRKINPRIQKAAWTKHMRSPRKPLLSTQSLQDVEDCNASDSEVTIIKRKPLETNVLQKASSLCDLRSHAVFQRPRIPKKLNRSRKVL